MSLDRQRSPESGSSVTISGTAKFLKEQNPDVRVIGVDTVGSVYAYYRKHGELPPAEDIHQYKIDGIGDQAAAL